MAVISDEHHNNKNEQEELEAYGIIVEQINGTSHMFDTVDCAMMFKRFSSVYGNDFADE